MSGFGTLQRVTDHSLQPAGLPPADVTINEQVVRDLLRAQHPDLTGSHVAHVATGWDNTTFRLGDDLAVRLPRIRVAAQLLEKEQRWLPVLAKHLPVSVPVPVRIGRPGSGYPWPWSIVPWVDGRSGEYGPLAPSQTRQMGAFLAALHRPAPPDAPRNTWRGVPLTAKVASVAAMIDRLAERSKASSAAVRWDRLLALLEAAVLAPVDIEETWTHADLHPKNIIVRDGALASVIDWGDLTVGDPAIDLASAWMLFPTSAHPDLWAAYTAGRTATLASPAANPPCTSPPAAISKATMTRAIGWAIFFGATMMENGLVNDQHFATIGRQTLHRICEDGGLPSTEVS
ncbi:MAG: aminoglycoside phosphotransferase family protein [Micromonosporaceae bacterium]|nr:aminoglycoside phosphotransferase family protein [Micromonosporaceae bacterium]